MKNSSTFGAIVTALLTAACNHSGAAQDAGPQVSRNFTVDQFDRIEVSGPYKVDVRTGAGPSVSASGSESLVERMVVQVEGGRLRIHPRKEEGRMKIWGNHGQVEVQVTVPNLRGAEIAGAGDITIDKVQGDSFEATIRGSGDIQIETAQTRSLAASVSGSGDIRASTGNADAVDLKIGGSGDINTQGLTARSASATIMGSGHISARATDTAAVRIMGSGDVEITGGAKCTVDNKGAGSFRCS
jgi:DUF4097 and DUF4098 domain-containing protein YvlB